MKKNSGFTLIEVLIAMFVLAIGLLGLAGLQATGMRNNLSAYHRSEATVLAYDLADRMRANSADSSLLSASTYSTVAPTTALIQNGCRQVANACTPAQMAQNDLFEWNRGIAGGAAAAGPPVLAAMPVTLPRGVGTVTIPAASRIVTIRINWDDNRDGCVNPQDRLAAVVGCVGVPLDDPNFQMSFQL